MLTFEKPLLSTLKYFACCSGLVYSTRWKIDLKLWIYYHEMWKSRNTFTAPYVFLIRMFGLLMHQNRVYSSLLEQPPAYQTDLNRINNIAHLFCYLFDWSCVTNSNAIRVSPINNAFLFKSWKISLFLYTAPFSKQLPLTRKTF